MPKPRVLTDEQRVLNHRGSSLKWSRNNAQYRRDKSKQTYEKNKDKINARRRELRLIKKNAEKKNHLN